VMRFRVEAGSRGSWSVPAELGSDYEPPSKDALAGAPCRAIALIERELEDGPSMLTMRELATADADAGGALVTINDGESSTRYRIAAAHFEDATTFFPMLGEYEV